MRCKFFAVIATVIVNIIGICCWSGAVCAADAATPSQSNFTIEIQVANDSLAERSKAFADGLKQVLVRSGVDEKVVASSSLAKSKLQKPDTCVRSYSYVTKKTLLGADAKYLSIQFDQTTITDLVTRLGKAAAAAQKSPPISAVVSQTKKQASQPLASLITSNPFSVMSQVKKMPDFAARNTVLFWIVSVNKGAKPGYILDDSNFNEVVLRLKKYAQEANIDVLFPEMDLEDMADITADDVCSLHAASIKTASARYNAKAVVAGCVIQSPAQGGRGRAQWLLLANGKQYSWRFSSNSEDEIVRQMLSSVAKLAKPQFFVTDNAKTDDTDTEIADAVTGDAVAVTMDINGVGDFQRYTEAVSYLKTVKQISSIELLGLDGSSVKLKVTCQGGRAVLAAQLSALSRLQTVASSDSDLAYEFK